MYNKLEDSYEKNRLYEKELQKSSYLVEYYRKIDKINSENRRYIHNIENYLKTIASLAAEDYNDEIVKLVESLEKHTLEISKGIYCKNKVLSAIIGEKKGEASKKGIHFSVQIEPTVNITFIEEIDLIGVIGNLLDNALEAAEKCQAEKQAVLRIFTSNNHKFIVCCVDNSCSEAPVCEKGKYITTKKDKKRHGLGMEYIKSIVEKYEGFLNISYEDGRCCTTVMIPNKVQEAVSRECIR